MEEAHKQKLIKLRDNYEYFAKSILKIKTKHNAIVPFKFNEPQSRLDAIITKLEKLGVPIRLIILKARQFGFSTYTEGKIYHKTSMKSLVESGIIAHKDDASTNLFNMSKLFYEESPETLRPMRKASNAKEIVFQNPTKDPAAFKYSPGLRSRIRLNTAGDREAGRSSTYQNLHVSELAFWPDAETTMTALMQTVPDHADTMIIIESTANGVGDYFHKLWKDAKEGKNDYMPLFFPWYEFSEYSMTPPDDFVLDENEQDIKKAYNLNDSQMYWRRWCIKNKCNGDVDKFRQEYPANDKEAFLMSGRPRFSGDTLLAYEANRQLEVKLTGDINHTGVEENENGYMKFFVKYKPKGQYAISVDVAEGLEHNDYTVAKIFDLETLEQVAEWHGHMEPFLFGTSVLPLIGRHYNNAHLVIERNNHGLTVVSGVVSVDYPQQLIFETNYQADKADDDFKDPNRRFGWLTTKKTKKLIIDNLSQMLNDEDIPALTEEDIEELMTYVIDAKGSTNAEINCFDDRVMTLAIFYYVREFIPIKTYTDFTNCTHCSHCVVTSADDYCSETSRKCSNEVCCHLYNEIDYEPDPKHLHDNYKSTGGYMPMGN